MMTLPVARVDIDGGVTTTKLRRGADRTCVTPPAARMPPEETVRLAAVPEAPILRAVGSVMARPRRVRSKEMSSAPKPASTRRTSPKADAPTLAAAE